MLTRMWHRSQSPVIGLAIDASSVRAIAIEQTENLFKVIAFGEAILPPQSLTTREVKDSVTLIRAIESACVSLPKKSLRIISALSDDAVISKTIPIHSLNTDVRAQPLDGSSHLWSNPARNMPGHVSHKKSRKKCSFTQLLHTEEEIMAQVLLTASRAIAYPAVELCADYRIISSSPVPLVSFVAARKETIAAYYRAVSEAGFKLSVIDVESQILAQTYHYFVPKNSSTETVVAIFIIEESRSLFVIVANNTAIYVKTESFTEEQIKKVSEFNNNSIATSLTDQQYQAEAMTLFFSVLAQQLKRHLQLFAMSNEYQPMQQIYITGKCASFTGISSFLANEIKLPVDVLSTFANFRLETDALRMLLPQASSWLFPCALALRGMIA